MSFKQREYKGEIKKMGLTDSYRSKTVLVSLAFIAIAALATAQASGIGPDWDISRCGSSEFLAGDGTCNTDTDTDTDNQNLNQVLNQGQSTSGLDIFVDNSNITTSSGNVTFGRSVKVYGEVWAKGTGGGGGGSGGSTSSGLSDILSNGNSAGSYNIDMNGN
ncbi:MAG: hypothetical protein ABEJ07_03170, partial [Candidatus Nanohaloarchaea archaeon]